MERIGVTLILGLSTLVITRVDSEQSQSYYVNLADLKQPRELREPSSSSSMSSNNRVHGRQNHKILILYDITINQSFPNSFP